ncbi:MAG: hypothetical protein O6761_05440 [Thaumarchaeota archaeon]|nr:hypothetical protein [Nitrososphaerota archaeon]
MRFFPKMNCSWLKQNGEFEIGSQKWSHTDYIRNHAQHIKCMPKPIAGDADSTALNQFMLETGWIRTSYYPTINKAIFDKVQPFTKDQRNTIKDLEIFGYECVIVEFEIPEEVK